MATITEQINKLEDALKFPRDLYESVLSNDLYSIEDRFDFLAAFPDFGITCMRHNHHIGMYFDLRIREFNLKQGSVITIGELIEKLNNCRRSSVVSTNKLLELKTYFVENRISKYCFDW
jgi:hypothetical protein